MWTVLIRKLGSNDYGQWALVDLCNDIIKISCVVTFDKEYQLTEKSVYSVKTIDIKKTKNGNISYKIGL